MKTIIGKWAELKNNWNAAFLTACQNAIDISSEIKTQCGQRIDPDNLLSKVQYNVKRIGQLGGPNYGEGFYIADCWQWWARPQPISDHWYGTISEWEKSLAALQGATPERLYALAMEMLK